MIKRLFLLVVVVLVALAVWVALRPRPVPVDVGVVSRGAVRAFVEEEGKTRIIDRYVVSAPIGGRLARIRFDEGAPIEKNQLVAEIDPLPLRSRIAEAKAQIQSLGKRIAGVERKKPKPEELDRAQALESVAEGALDVAKRQLEEADASLAKATSDRNRVRKLLRSGSATQEELDAVDAVLAETTARQSARQLNLRIRNVQIAAARLDTAILKSRRDDFEWEKGDYEQQIAAIEARLLALSDDLKHTRVLAPASGTVLNLFEESRRVVTAGTPLLDIGNLKKLEIEADFLSEDVAHMREQMHVEIFGRALGDTVLQGKILRIHPSAFKKISSLGVEQQRVSVIVAFDAAKAALGDRYRVELRVILEERKDALLVPESALFRHGGAWHVFRVRDGAARLAPVETGLRDGRVREVLRGLDAGDKVILHPDPELEDGAAVEKLAVDHDAAEQGS